MELSKSDKKATRIIIEKGIQQEFFNGLTEFSKILCSWKSNNTNNRDTYHLLYKSVKEFDKHVSFRYDRMSGSNYIFVIAAQLSENLISEKDLTDLSAEAQNAIKRIVEIHSDLK